MHIESRQDARTPLGNDSILAQAINDHYRFPDGLLKFSLSGDLSSEPRFFRFGPVTCYGRSIGNHHQGPAWPQFDMLSTVEAEGSQVLLPFNPTEVIDNLRLERYTDGQFDQYEGMLKRIYYRLRPFTNRALRSYVQRLRASSGHNKEFPKWPVDTTVENLSEILLLLWLQANRGERIPFIWFWPRGAGACVLMTHDVETAVGRNFCDQLLDINDSYGIKASFQIVPEERYRVTEVFLNQLRDRGCEVCIQDLNHDGRLFDQHNEFRRRVFLINQYGREYHAKGFRSAVLYRKPDWYGDLDFSYDMSMPNVAHLDPQRGGCCTVMPYFIGEVLELPLTTVQDYTLFHILKEHSIDIWKNQSETILSKHGLLSFIVHPDYITEPKAQASYKELLTMLAELRERKNLWLALPRDIDWWWRARGQMSIVRNGNNWKIIGDGADQAVLAFAQIQNGRLCYEFPNTARLVFSHHEAWPEGNGHR